MKTDIHNKDFDHGLALKLRLMPFRKWCIEATFPMTTWEGPITQKQINVRSKHI